LKNGQGTVRYREFDHSTVAWILNREFLGNFKDITAARNVALPIMMRPLEVIFGKALAVNKGLLGQPDKDSFVALLWRQDAE
jgi:hypothetical protein